MKMKKVIVVLMALMLTFTACAKKEIKEEQTTPAGTPVVETPQLSNYVPVNPFPPFPPGAEVYIGEGRAVFEKDPQIAEHMAMTTALGDLTKNFLLEIERTLTEDIYRATSEGDGYRIYSLMSEIEFKGPVPGKKFTEKIMDRRNGEILVRVYVSKYEIDRYVIPFYLRMLDERTDMAFSNALRERYRKTFTDKAYAEEERKQARILGQHHFDVLERIRKGEL
jgi:hypothetical protein